MQQWPTKYRLHKIHSTLPIVTHSKNYSDNITEATVLCRLNEAPVNIMSPFTVSLH